MNLRNTDVDFDFTIMNLEYVVEVESKKPVEEHVLKLPENVREYVLSLTTQGETDYTINGQHYRISKGDILFFPRYMPRKREREQHGYWRHIVVLFHLQFHSQEVKEKLDQMNHVFCNLDQTKVPFLFHELLQGWVGKQPGFLIRCRSRILEILHALIVDSLEHKTSHLRMVELLVALMDADEQRFYTIEELSAEVGVSPSYLSLIFKKITGLTVIQYQNRIKIGKAYDLLSSGEYNVTAVAERLGFRDIYYFSRLYKKIMGNSPSSVLKR
jgi:AraC-like DNA-binding protein